MSEQNDPGMRLYLPLTVPMTMNFIGSAWVAVAASRARNAGACGLSLPWSQETSYVILKYLFPAAYEEAETFKTISSACIADLHADSTSAYIIILMASVIIGFLSLKYTRFRQLAWYTEDHIKNVKTIWAGFALSFIAIVGYYIAVDALGIIDFSGKMRRMLHVRSGYVNPLGYWFVMQVASFMLIAAFWCFYISVNTWRSLIKYD